MKKGKTFIVSRRHGSKTAEVGRENILKDVYLDKQWPSREQHGYWWTSISHCNGTMSTTVTDPNFSMWGSGAPKNEIWLPAHTAFAIHGDSLNLF